MLKWFWLRLWRRYEMRRLKLERGLLAEKAMSPDPEAMEQTYYAAMNRLAQAAQECGKSIVVAFGNLTPEDIDYRRHNADHD